MHLTGREKATIFLSILGEETSTRILRYLPEDLADLIASSLNHLPTPTPEALGEVLEDFKSHMALPPPAEEPKINYENLAPLEIIEQSPAQNVAFILVEERPQIIAYMLSLLSQRKKEEVLSQISSQRDIVEELLNGIVKSPMAPNVQEKLAKYFSEKLV